MKKITVLFVVVSLFTACSWADVESAKKRQKCNVNITVLPEGREYLPAKCKNPVTLWTEKMESPRKVVVHYLKVALNSKRVEPFVLLSEDPDGPKGPAEGVLTNTKQLFDSSESCVLALVNANAFAGIRSIPNPKGKRGWYTGRQVDIQGLAVADGEVRSPAQKGRVPLWFDKKGRPHLSHPKANDKVMHAVSDWFCPLVIDGKAIGDEKASDSSLLDEDDQKDKSIDNSIHPRSMIGFDKEKKWLLLAVVDGRQRGYSIGLSLKEQAELMKSKGCYQAINMDGGGSSVMLIRGDDGKAKTVNRPSGGRARPAPVMIGVRCRP